MRFKGTYRILPELDVNTHDFPRDANDEIDDGYDDLYISCYYGNKIFMYGHDVNKRAILSAYIPSLGRGRNIKRVLDDKAIPYTDYLESDSEVCFNFKAKDIEEVAKLLKAKTAGADISPFSVKNLPKNKDVEIPSDEIERYREITSKVQKGDLLLIHKITSDFLSAVLQKRYTKYDKKFDYKRDMKKLMLARQIKEYIWTKEMWEEYLQYLDKEIQKYYNGGVKNSKRNAN